VKNLRIEVYPGIYLNEIPLPDFSLKAVNSYVIVSEQRNLIVDTGFNTEEGRKALIESLKELKVDLRKTDLILTHMHPDHVGMASYLQELGATVFIGRVDGELINNVYSKTSKTTLAELYEILTQQQDIIPMQDNEFGDNSTELVNFHYLNEGDRICVGDYVFEIVNTPGHTPGHIGLYEKSHKLFFCGDHILEHISPSVMFWGYEHDILGLYMNSLEKVHALDLDYLFTAHLSIIRDHRRRINELLSHCEERLEETRCLTHEEKKTPREIAAQLHWNIKTSWNDFTKTEKFFAIGETLTFLEHLTHKQELRRLNVDGNLYYALKNRKENCL
jgi:glyoxylase-like metal-dependent hydrolase (beta-lactamase superfamily II)